MSKLPTQKEIAELLEEIAGLLDVQDANVFRIRSYRQGARTILESDADIVGMAQREDMDALGALPNIGEGLARVISEYVTTGRSSLRDELRGKLAPGRYNQSIKGT